MDPITIFFYGLAITLGAIVARDVIKNVFVFSSKKIVQQYRKNFENHRIVILGGEQSGKTSLMLLLTKGYPYFSKVNNIPEGPGKTQGFVVVPDPTLKNKETPNINKLDRILKDVAGDKKERDLWGSLLIEVKPHGIIYMIDGRQIGIELENAVNELFIDVLQHSNALQYLRALHIFVNYSDQMDERARLERPLQILGLFRRRFDPEIYSNLKKMGFDISVIQLAPQSKDWYYAGQALDKFGRTLRLLD